MPHPHFVHNLKVVFILMPRSLKTGKKIRFRHYVTIKKKQLPRLFLDISVSIRTKASKLLHKLASQAVSVTTIQFSHYNIKAGLGYNIQMNGYSCIPIKLYLQNQAVGIVGIVRLAPEVSYRPALPRCHRHLII